MPRTVEVELTEDLVDSCVPGDEVTITGVVKVSQCFLLPVYSKSRFQFVYKTDNTNQT